MTVAFAPLPDPLPDPVPDVATAREGETLDLLIWRVRGAVDAASLAATLARNPGIAAGALLAPGTPVTLPARADAVAPTLGIVQLWE